MPPSGTEPINFQGGSWDGEIADIVKQDPPGRKAERWHREDGEGVPGLIDIYVRSEDFVMFQPKRLKNPKKSTTFKFAGTVRR